MEAKNNQEFTDPFQVKKFTTISLSDDAKLTDSKLADTKRIYNQSKDTFEADFVSIQDQTDPFDFKTEIGPFNSNICNDSLSKDDPFNDNIFAPYFQKNDSKDQKEQVNSLFQEAKENSSDEEELSFEKLYFENEELTNFKIKFEESKSAIEFEKLSANVTFLNPDLVDKYDENSSDQFFEINNFAKQEASLEDQYVFKRKISDLENIEEDEQESSDKENVIKDDESTKCENANIGCEDIEVEKSKINRMKFRIINENEQSETENKLTEDQLKTIEKDVQEMEKNDYQNNLDSSDIKNDLLIDKIEQWRIENESNRLEKDKKEERLKEELNELAIKELNEWYATYRSELEAKKVNNRAFEENLLKESKEVESSKSWKTVVDLCDFSFKNGAHQKDTSRFKSVLLKLKNSNKQAI